MLPIVRSACEPCHERKIRCLIPPHGGSCQACMTSRRQCYFLPRHKAGRPRRGSRTLSSTLSSRHTTPPLPDPPTDNEVTELSHDHEWHTTSTLPSFMNNALPTSDVSLPADLQTFTSAPSSHPTIIPDYFSTNDNVGFQPQPQSNGNSESGLSCGPLTGSLSDSSGASLFPRIYPLGQGHSRVMGTPEASTGTGGIKPRSPLTQHLVLILRAIDVLCDLCAAFVSENPPPCPKKSLDPALLALVIAANFKVLEVCGLLVSITVSDMQRPHDQLLLKRIDFNLMQTKIALTSMKEREMTSPLVFQTALDQAACIHRQIMAMTEG
ncbi:hypothetical protein N7519_005568 [Penicillium mononematosum]|uniref:uncharacterized protein n=1 Tax=Penicillium mononematosum TaxID=268346 RepID=UPI0025465C5A|nr:uncharacterized protein N7519_005568 [Penicillium mononematosum]KAJ6184267.1 hypothetical protein N7519_005568 [Penicillium mononematosum]